MTAGTARIGGLADWRRARAPTSQSAHQPIHGPWLRLAAFAALAGFGAAYWASFVANAPAGRVVGVLAIACALGAVLIVLGRTPLPRPAVHALAALATLVALAFGAGGDRPRRRPAEARPLGRLRRAARPRLRRPAPRLLALRRPRRLRSPDDPAGGPARAHPGRGAGLLARARRSPASTPSRSCSSSPSTRSRSPTRSSAATSAAALLLLGADRGLAVAAARWAAAARWRARPRWRSPGCSRCRWRRRSTPIAPGSTTPTGRSAASATRRSRFDWNHRYGPIDWPRSGRTLLAVRSDEPHYWKAETLDEFDGLRWSHSNSGERRTVGAELPDRLNPAWEKRISFTVRDLRSDLLIGAGTFFDTEGDIGVDAALGRRHRAPGRRPAGEGRLVLDPRLCPRPDARTRCARRPTRGRRRCAATSRSPCRGRARTRSTLAPGELRRRPLAEDDRVMMPFRGEPTGGIYNRRDGPRHPRVALRALVRTVPQAGT